MKLLLLDAYRKAMDDMGRIASYREHANGKGYTGIMVNEDPYALEYQKRDRQARKFYNALRRVLAP